MLLVESDSALNSVVAQCVSMSKVLGDDTRAGLVFLLNVVVLFFGVGGGLGSLGASDVVEVLAGFDGNDGGAQLGLVEKESSFCGTV